MHQIALHVIVLCIGIMLKIQYFFPLIQTNNVLKTYSWTGGSWVTRESSMALYSIVTTFTSLTFVATWTSRALQKHIDEKLTYIFKHKESNIRRVEILMGKLTGAPRAPAGPLGPTGPAGPCRKIAMKLHKGLKLDQCRTYFFPKF